MARPQLRNLLPSRLRSRFGLKTPQGPNRPSQGEDPLLQAGRMVRQQREARGLNLRQLAVETRISTPVLEAIERGWRDRLPESTYLRTMLPLIEQHLDLPAGSLLVALPADLPGAASRRRGSSLLGRFTPGSIDVFTTWQGTVLYGVLTLGLIYGLNLQQQVLVDRNLLSQRPIQPLPLAEQVRSVDAGSLLLQLYPALRPLNQAQQGVGRSQLNQLLSSSENPTGVLRLQLAEPSRISLRSASGESSELNGAKGELALRLLPPLELKLEPAPKQNSVYWNGQPLAPQPKRPGSYTVPATTPPTVPRPEAATKASSP